jgi:hypothetical protein
MPNPLHPAPGKTGNFTQARNSMQLEFVVPEGIAGAIEDIQTPIHTNQARMTSN